MTNLPQTQATDSPTQVPTIPYRQDAANHIRDLSKLNETIPTLLRTSATAISQLTTRPIVPPRPLSDPDSALPPDTPETRKDVLLQCTIDLFTFISTTSSALNEQIADLQAASVIPATQIRVAPIPITRPGQQADERPRDPESTVTNGGLGDLDVGILNARAGVRQAGGEEVLDRVKGILEELVREREGEELNKMVVDG
ncbi:hypothetical protein K504DRAFT_462825 [Pleomassaria siparia CBS 279.74]|uniref:Mediator of RNA polymerase II transcription subunit 11 n=1 Tax=Pleomassaria siparia CBS 279.74 TaxID=1314801 RepID=A0A6G1JV97_9PLEO|nr:hypothetical protein K504DRAFT_462825 [Pleomassaria siparia CBS 279.74]